MKKTLFIVMLGVFLVPQIVFAAWWNPFSWKVFQKTENKTQVLENRVKELERKLENTASSTKATTTGNPVSDKKKSEKIQGKTKVVTPVPVFTKTDQQQKTFTLPNGSVVDESGNVIKSALAQQQTTETSVVDNKNIGINYYLSKKTCIGLGGEQYTYCVSYAFSPEGQADQQTQQSQTQQTQNQNFRNTQQSQYNTTPTPTPKVDMSEIIVSPIDIQNWQGGYARGVKVKGEDGNFIKNPVVLVVATKDGKPLADSSQGNVRYVYVNFVKTVDEYTFQYANKTLESGRYIFTYIAYGMSKVENIVVN